MALTQSDIVINTLDPDSTVSARTDGTRKYPESLTVGRDSTADGGQGAAVPWEIDSNGIGQVNFVGAGEFTEYTQGGDAVANPIGGTLIMERVDTFAERAATAGKWASLAGTKYGEPYFREAGGALGNGATPVDATAGGTQILAASLQWRRISLTNLGPNTCYIGTGTVTTANGYPLLSGESIPLATTSEVKGICASGETADIRRLVETVA